MKYFLISYMELPGNYSRSYLFVIKQVIKDWVESFCHFSSFVKKMNVWLKERAQKYEASSLGLPNIMYKLNATYYSLFFLMAKMYIYHMLSLYY